MYFIKICTLSNKQIWNHVDMSQHCCWNPLKETKSCYTLSIGTEIDRFTTLYVCTIQLLFNCSREINWLNDNWQKFKIQWRKNVLWFLYSGLWECSFIHLCYVRAKNSQSKSRYCQRMIKKRLTKNIMFDRCNMNLKLN